MKVLRFFFTFLFCIPLYAVAQDSSTEDYRWDDRFASTHYFGGGFRGATVYSTAFLNNDLYIGGSMSYLSYGGARDSTRQYFLRWDGQAYHAVTDTLNESWPFEMQTVNNSIYIRMSGEDNVIREFDGASMIRIGEVTEGFVFGMEEIDDELVIYGSFTKIDSLIANGIARWDGNQWQVYAEGLPDYTESIAFYKGRLCAGWGSNVSCWTGTEWESIFEGSEETVRALEVGNDHLYVSGIQVDSLNAQKRIARWDGLSWEALDILDLTPHLMAWYNEELVFMNRNNFMRWNGTDLVNQTAEGPFQYFTNVDIWRLDVFNDEVYISGRFSAVGNVKTSNIARWNGIEWLPVERGGKGIGIGDGLPLMSFTGSDEYLYVGGPLETAGILVVGWLARWSGEQWERLGALRFLSQFRESTVRDIEMYKGDLYYGGGHAVLSDEARTITKGIARWDGQEWDPIGSTFQPLPFFSDVRIEDMEVYNDELYVTGFFSGVDGMDATLLVKWDGVSWSKVEHPFIESSISRDESVINKMYSHEGTLYVTGLLKESESDSVSYLAAFDGQGWERFEQDLDAPGLAMTTFDGDLVVGGMFTSAGEVEVNRIARWTGAEWLPFGEGFTGEVRADVNALLVQDDTLYAGGLFNASGGKPLNSIARWNGLEWESLGSGVSGGVHTMAVFGGGLYAGGGIQKAGNKVSSSIARWDLGAVSTEAEEWELNTSTSLSPNYPNPLTHQTSIPYSTAAPTYVRIDLYDILGRKVRTLVSHYHTPGEYEISFQDDGLPAGVYMYRLQTDQGEALHRFMTIVQ